MNLARLAPFSDSDIWSFLLGGMALTLEAAALAMILSVLIGTLLALCRLSTFKPVSIAAVAYIETIRSLPVFLIMIYAYFGVYRLSFELPSVGTVVLGLTIYHSAKNAELIRAGIQSVPKGLWEAGYSQGLTHYQVLRYIVMPPAFRRMIPPLVGELIVCLKNTSIGSVVGLNEILRRGTIVYQQYLNPFETLVVVAVIYWCLCYGLSLLSRRLELSGGRRR
jgi:His/Glu/Gln/Arg/opine family amino acid ABC transporter permease subunit